MENKEILVLIDSMLDVSANGDGRMADEASIWNRALITLGRKIDPNFHQLKVHQANKQALDSFFFKK